ncbi:unnamed protein product [Diatraea saccharalis]|uniref:Uncharacterized protein n=1 Tax=Diatraea saccharalis TaxID=40085 RepID=A0A9N9QYI6_9NEOP|nr:unnamed protein product [Diatraea saccharalis]
MKSIQESMAELQQYFTGKMDEYQSELQAASPSPNINNLKSDFAAFRSFIMTVLQGLQQQVGLLAHQVDNIEMRTRRKMLLCHGLPEVKDEDAAAVITNAIVDRLKITEFTVDSISKCHRMGRASGNGKPRPILLKVHDIRLRDKIWFAKTALKKSGITISEFLTKARHDVFMAARDAFGVHKCFTQQGLVMVIGTDGKRTRISSMEELKKLTVTVELTPETAKEATVPLPLKPVITTKSRRAGVASKK